VSIDPSVETVTIVEIEPLVPQVAGTFFRDANFNVVENPKVRLHIDDGRHYVLTSKERFDAITADPLDPWVKGAANLYTKEFLQALKEHLNPGGVITLYLQLFENNEAAVRSTLATFIDVFPNGTFWGNTFEGKGYDIVLLGTVEPPRIDIEDIDRRLATMEYGRVAQSLAEVEIGSATDLFATYAGRGADLKPWLLGAPLNLDGNLRMQYLAGTSLDRDDSAAIYASMLRYRRFPEGLFSTAGTKQRDPLRETIDNANP
jgi:spermidine synthase